MRRRRRRRRTTTTDEKCVKVFGKTSIIIVRWLSEWITRSTHVDERTNDLCLNVIHARRYLDSAAESVVVTRVREDSARSPNSKGSVQSV